MVVEKGLGGEVVKWGYLGKLGEGNGCGGSLGVGGVVLRVGVVCALIQKTST